MILYQTGVEIGDGYWFIDINHPITSSYFSFTIFSPRFADCPAVGSEIPVPDFHKPCILVLAFMLVPYCQWSRFIGYWSIFKRSMDH